jgi:hypothetical protein
MISLLPAASGGIMAVTGALNHKGALAGHKAISQCHAVMAAAEVEEFQDLPAVVTTAEVEAVLPIAAFVRAEVTNSNSYIYF